LASKASEKALEDTQYYKRTIGNTGIYRTKRGNRIILYRTKRTY
jgi:hypothetical protein